MEKRLKAHRVLRVPCCVLRFALFAAFVLFVVAACAAPHPATATATPAPPTASPTPAPTETLIPTPTPTPAPTDFYLTPGDVLIYPSPDLFSGDVLSFDVMPRDVGAVDPHDIAVRVERHAADGVEVVAQGSLGAPTFEGTPLARLTWAWDTAGLESDQVITVSLDPADRIQEGDADPTNNVVTLTVSLRPADERPADEVAATWVTTTTACCVIHYLTGSAAERDLTAIAAAVQHGVDTIETEVDTFVTKPLPFYLVDREFGHGAYTWNVVAISRLDRQYTSTDVETAVRHEGIHILDAQRMAAASPAILQEGWAVWIAGGHYWPDPLPQRAAALLQLDRYIPLDLVADDFYRQQHETSYLEAGALAGYLVETCGREGFQRLHSTSVGPYETPAEALGRGLQETCGAGLAETEQGFLRWLEAHPPTPDQVRDLEVTIGFFDTMRRYQETYDPGAYFMTGWLPDPWEGERRGIVADFTRSPSSAVNVALETMLAAAMESLRAGEFDRAQALLDEVNGVLDTGTFAGLLAGDTLAIVQATAAAGSEAQRIELTGDTATVWVAGEGSTLVPLTLQRTSAGWTVGE